MQRKEYRRKKYFFNRQVNNSESYKIFIIKPPHSYFGKPDVPNDKKQGYNRRSKNKCFKMPVEFYLMMEGKNKTDDNRKKID
jgi:hypothetical protein